MNGRGFACTGRPMAWVSACMRIPIAHDPEGLEGAWGRILVLLHPCTASGVKKADCSRSISGRRMPISGERRAGGGSKVGTGRISSQATLQLRPVPMLLYICQVEPYARTSSAPISVRFHCHRALPPPAAASPLKAWVGNSAIRCTCSPAWVGFEPGSRGSASSAIRRHRLAKGRLSLAPAASG